MPHLDQFSHPAADPGRIDAESVHRVYLSADIRPAIRTATARQLRAALTEITRHLCQHLTGPPGLIPPPGPGEPWQSCQSTSGTRTGLQHHHSTLRAIAARYLHAIGFDPARATYLTATTGPFLRAARKRRLRQILFRLADCADATVRDADLAFGAAGDALVGLPEDAHEEGAGAITAIMRYRYAVRDLTVHVLVDIWDALGITSHQPQAFRPFTDADFHSTHPN